MHRNIPAAVPQYEVRATELMGDFGSGSETEDPLFSELRAMEADSKWVFRNFQTLQKNF